MNKERIIFWGIVLVFGLILIGCAGYYGSYRHDDQFPYNYTPGVGRGGVGGGYRSGLNHQSAGRSMN